MFDGDFEDRCSEKIPLVLMGEARQHQASVDEEKGPHRGEWNFLSYLW